MTLTANRIDESIAKLPKHFMSVVKYLFGEGELRTKLVESNLKRLELINASAVASMCVYRSGDYDTDTKFQEYIFDVLKKGAVEKTALDSPRSLLKKEIRRAFLVPDFLNRCIDFGLDTPDKIADVLLGATRTAPLEQSVLRNMFVQTHVSIILILLANDLGQPLNKENKRLLLAIRRPITGHEINLFIGGFWNRYKYIGLIVLSFGLLAFGGTQGLSLISEPSIYLPFSDIQSSNLSPKNIIFFKLSLSVIFILMLYLIIGNKFHYLVQPDRKSNLEVQKKTKKVVPAFYMFLLFFLSGPVIDYIDSFTTHQSPIELAVENRDFKQAEKLVRENRFWSGEQKDFVLAQLVIKQRYELPMDTYQAKLAEHSKNVLSEFSFGRYSTEYGESYAIKQILDANNKENDLVSYNVHRAVFAIWLLTLVYCFLSLAVEVDYFGIRQNKLKRLEAKQSSLDSQTS